MGGHFFIQVEDFLKVFLYCRDLLVMVHLHVKFYLSSSNGAENEFLAGHFEPKLTFPNYCNNFPKLPVIMHFYAKFRISSSNDVENGFYVRHFGSKTVSLDTLCNILVTY